MFPLRDVLLTVTIIGSLPVCFLRPWIGVLMWTWIGVMTPHRLTWGFAYDFPFAQLVGLATLAGVPFARDRQPLPRTREVYLLAALWLLFTVTTIMAMSPAEAREQWERVTKIFLFTFVGLMFLQDERRVRWLVLVLALSVGFYGLKGGIWALSMGGTERVQAPAGGFIGGTNGLALGLDMVLPFFVFLAREEQNPWLRRLFWTMFFVSIPAVLFTYSRGGLLGLAVVLAVLAVRFRRIGSALAVATVAILLVAIAPERWFQRVSTIVNYEGDGSALGRLLAWDVAFRFALDHPFLGGGFFATANESVYLHYAGVAEKLVPHSSWFSVLSEHGFTGLILFVALIACCILTLRRLRRARNGHQPPAWVVNYSHMLQIGLVGYIVAGSFVNAAYMNLFYYLVMLVILLDVLTARGTSGAPAPPPEAAARRLTPVGPRRVPLHGPHVTR